MPAKRKLYWGKSIASFFLVLFTMPLGHALMMIMGKFMDPVAVHYAGFFMGLAGLIIVIWGVFVKGDTKQTLFGLFGGLLFWTGWVEFLFQYYAHKYGAQPEITPQGHVTQPEYLLFPMTFGLWAMVMTLYMFCTKTGCCFINWCQKHLFRGHEREIVARPMTRHTSIVTFMELNVMMWTTYIALMFCYDPTFIGDQSWFVKFLMYFCLCSSVYMFYKELHQPSWGANIRMAIATVIIFWCSVEISARLNLFTEIWIEPEKHIPEMAIMLVCFFGILAFVILDAYKNRK